MTVHPVILALLVSGAYNAVGNWGWYTQNPPFSTACSECICFWDSRSSPSRWSSWRGKNRFDPIEAG